MGRLTEVIGHVREADREVTSRTGCPLVIELVAIATFDLKAWLVGDVKPGSADKYIELVFYAIVAICAIQYQPIAPMDGILLPVRTS